MHLLFIDANPESARAIHSEFLDYRGVHWILSHCEDYRTAIELLEQDSFQSLLYHSDYDYDQVMIEVSELLRTSDCPPLLAVTGNLSPYEQLNLVRDGSDDCFNDHETSGSGIMRHLRMAEMRKAVCTEQAMQVAEGRVPGVSVDQLLSDSSVADADETTEQIDRALRIAHVSYRSSLIDEMQFGDTNNILLHYDCLSELLEALDQSVHKFDALIVEQSTFERAIESETIKLAKYLAVVPGIVLTMEKSDFAALSYLERGYSDCLTADHTSAEGLAWTIRKAVVRRRRGLLQSLSEDQIGPGVSDRRSDLRNSLNRRRRVRFALERSIVAIPILPNGAPDRVARCDALTTTVSLNGVGVSIPSSDQLPHRNWIIGVQQENGSTGYASAFLRRVSYQADEIQAALIFQNPAEDFLGRHNLWPQVNPDSKQFTTKVPNALLDQWVELGVLTKRLARRTRTCPQCEAVCSVGTGCSQCGGFDLLFHDLIHHFACAHVNEASAFEHADEIECPKCLCKHLVAGADFEVIRSQYECQACNYRGEATAQVGCCLNCQLRFPLEIAPEVEVYGYDVERMDILALVDTARQAAIAGDAATDI